MAKPTVYFRHVFCDASEGNGTLRVLSVQQWWEADPSDQNHVVNNGGYWQDLKISYTGRTFDSGPEVF